MVPGTFWYDFLTGPALGGLGALCAALLIGGASLVVSRDRREDATADRKADRKRTGREEWFRRLLWAQQLVGADDPETQAAGYEVLQHLGESDLASADDLVLLLRLTRTGELDAAATTSASPTDDNRYILDTNPPGQAEEDL